jgi:hypothetical protein
MIKRYLPLIALFAITVSCSKDKLETRPTIEIKSINATALPDIADFLINIEFRDKEGDLSNGQVTYIRNRLNTTPIMNDLADTVLMTLPEFPKSQTGEFQIRINAGFLNERPKGTTTGGENNDTVSFKIFAKDAAGNVSDTISTVPLVQIDQ